MLSFLAACAMSGLQTLSAPTEPPLNTNAVIAAAEAKAGLHFDDLYPRKPLTGRMPTQLKWSKDGRYLAFEWAPYDTKGGNDLYVYDADQKKLQRITSPEVMSVFDRKVPRAIKRYIAEAEDEARAMKMNDLQWREWRIKKKQEDLDRKKPLPAYPAVTDIAWSPKSDEMLFEWGGDIYRTGTNAAKPTRLTRTAEIESDVRWLPDGDGYTFQRSGGVFRVRFASSSIEQLNPELPKGVVYTGYRLSPDASKLMVTASKPSGVPSRQVDYLDYTGRFAVPKKMTREVADDVFNGEEYIYLYDLSQDSLDGLTGDGSPWEVWKWPGGRDWQQTSVNENPWSPDSKRFVFGTWKRNERDQQIVVANLDKKTLSTIYSGRPSGEEMTPGLARPFFTKDGAGVIALLDAGGFRQPWLLDPLKEGAMPITTGNYESYPLQESMDGKHLFVRAHKEDPARSDVYSVDMTTHEMRRLTHHDGWYANPTVTEDGSRVAATFADWTSPTELEVVSGEDEHVVTHSHNLKAFEKINTLRPHLFTFLNREGRTIHGFMFLPPDWRKTDKRPVMIYVYGGPLGTDKSVQEGSFNTTAYWFNMYLAKVFGYVTATIDPRGQSGYGSAFGSANWQQPGKAQVEDLTDGVKYLEANYGVDPKKVAVNGWSFGGFQTQMCLYTAPDVFTLGIAGAGPVQWQNYNNWYSTGVIGPVPNAKPEDLDKYSLTYLAKNLRSPLLLLHGMVDTNVMFQDTIKVYQKLLQYGRGPLVELAFDPTGNHGLGGDIDTRDRHAIYLGFINKWWGPYVPPQRS